eukprot:Skav210700  [mRNA]  locus=scaffold1240:73522:75873:- [translate_table: standard]
MFGQAQPLNLGTITFHFAALVSVLTLETGDIDIIRDKYVPEPDEEPNDDVIRILKALQEADLDDKSYKIRTLEAKNFQRLVSAWRISAEQFGSQVESIAKPLRLQFLRTSQRGWSYGDEDAFVLRSRLGEAFAARGAKLECSSQRR